MNDTGKELVKKWKIYNKNFGYLYKNINIKLLVLTIYNQLVHKYNIFDNQEGHFL